MSREARPRQAVVTLPALDLRFEPRHAAELGSQLLLGETVRILARGPERGWVRVRNDADGYSGWVREWGLVAASSPRIAAWRKKATARIDVAMAQVLTAPGEGAAVSPVFFGNRLIAGRSRSGHRPVELPDGRRGYLPDAAFSSGHGRSLAERVLALLGTPYLWGGRTPAGYDCSAFVQQVLREQRVALPRDAKDQCRRCRKLPDRVEPLPGDLVFFRRPGEAPSHVGIALGDNYFAHCRGRVHVASVDPADPVCDHDLLPQFMGWYRTRLTGK